MLKISDQKSFPKLSKAHKNKNLKKNNQKSKTVICKPTHRYIISCWTDIDRKTQHLSVVFVSMQSPWRAKSQLYIIVYLVWNEDMYKQTWDIFYITYFFFTPVMTIFFLSYFVFIRNC